MKLFSALILLSVAGFSVTALAGQQSFEVRMAMEESSIAAFHPKAAAFVNPTLFALKPPLYENKAMTMMWPVLDVEVTNFRDFNGEFDALKGGYIELGMAPITVFYKSYIDAIGLADISPLDIATLQNTTVVTSQTIYELEPQKGIAAGVTELGVALSFPLSIVNMPIAVSISPKFQRIDGYNYGVRANHFGSGTFDDKPQNDETKMNLDLGLAMQLTDNIVMGVSGRDLISHDIDSIDYFERPFSYHIDVLYSAAIAFESDSYSLTTNIDLNSNKDFIGETYRQYLYVGGELRPVNWLALRLNYRHNFRDRAEDIYSFGTGFTIGNNFNFDVTGVLGSGDNLGGVIQTSYHF